MSGKPNAKVKHTHSITLVPSDLLELSEFKPILATCDGCDVGVILITLVKEKLLVEGGSPASS